MKELKQVRQRKGTGYNQTQEYLGKQSGGDMGDGTGNNIQWDSEITGAKEIEQDGRNPNGILGDLPKEIQDYVNHQVGRTMQSQNGYGENGQGEDIQQGESGTPTEKGISEVISAIFDAPMPESVAQIEKELADAIEQHIMNNSLGQPEETNQVPPPAQSDSSQNDSGEQEKPKGDNSCTDAERRFLDAFMALQEAGKLLGLVPSTRAISETRIRNVRLVPVINQVKESDKQYATEMQQENEVYEMMSGQTKILFESVETMLTDKGL
jgi:hypothetical protein